MIADVTEARADELNRMIAARPKDSTGVCAAQPAADYFYDADNLRSIKRLWSAGGTQPLSFTTTVRGGLDGLSDITTHVSDGLETKSPYEQKNYVYGPGGLIASEKRVLYANSNPAWQIYGASTGCAVNNPAASAEALASNGYDLLLNFGACFSATVQSMVLEWHELNADGTPKDCTNQRTDATTNFNARYNCGLLHLNPATGTARLYKLKYASTSYDVKVTESVEMGLYGTKTFVVSRFTASLAKGQPTTALVYNDQTPPPPAPGASLGAPGPGGREVNYYQKDHLGTIRVVSDENGTVLSTHDYEPFGLELPSQDFSFNTHRFTGHERDTETGLDYMKARYFGASMGRFGVVDVGRIDKYDPQSINRYPYALNNPVTLLDLNGHEPDDPEKKNRWDSLWDKVGNWFHNAFKSNIANKNCDEDACGFAQDNEGGRNQRATDSVGDLSQKGVKGTKLATEYIATEGALKLVGASIGMGWRAVGEALSKESRIQHAADHLIKEGLLPKWNKQTGEMFKSLAARILSAPDKTISYKLGGEAVTGYVGKEQGKNIVIFVYEEGKYKGLVATAIVPDTAQAARWGIQ